MDRLLAWWKGPLSEEEARLPAPLPPDRLVGGFQVLGLLGDGGTATVYKAQDSAGAEAAVKIPHRGVLSDREFVAAFRREAELGVSLRHPSIVRVLDAGAYATPDFREVPYFAMERLHGQDLGTLLREKGRLPQQLAVCITRAIADALDWAHQRGVVHRDVSPSNIFLTDHKAVKVMDFGISAVCSQRGGRLRGMGRGTPAYLAPERIADHHLADPQVDLYALGCVLYEMLAGIPPYVADHAEDVLRMHLSRPIPPLPVDVDVHPRLQRILLRLLQKEPGSRSSSARELLVELAELL